MEDQYPPIYLSIILKSYLVRKRRLAERMSSLQSSVVNLRKRKAELEAKVTELEKAVVNRIDDLSGHGFHIHCPSAILLTSL